MGEATSKAVFSLTLGIVSIFYLQFRIILVNLLPLLTYFSGPWDYFRGIILAVIGLYFSRASIKGLDSNNQNAKTLIFAKAGKICCIIGIYLNFFIIMPILWFLFLALLPQ